MGLAVPAARSHSWAHLQSQQTLSSMVVSPGSISGYPVLSHIITVQCARLFFFHQNLSAQCSAAWSMFVLFGLSFVLRFAESLIKITPQATEILSLTGTVV